MIDIVNNLIILDKAYELLRWETWFRSPFGLHQTTDSAITRLESVDGGDPNLLIQPVSVAIGPDNIYEIKE